MGRGLIAFLFVAVNVFAGTTPPSPNATPSPILFVVMGGHNSCNKSQTTVRPLGTGVYLNYDTVAPNWNSRGAKISVITTCLYGDAPPEGEMDYVLPDGSTHVGDAYDLAKEINALVKKQPTTRLYFIGHSYGAWTGMFLAESMNNPAKIEALITIDPIGPGCDTLGVIFGSDDCHQAPTDRDNAAIAKKVGIWLNFYQDADDWLTSSEIPEATKNHYIDFGWGPHGDIDADRRVWTAIDQSVKTTF